MPQEAPTSTSTENNQSTTPAAAPQQTTATPETKPAEPTPASTTAAEPAKTAEVKPAASTPAEPKAPEFNLKPEDYGNFGLDEKTEPIKEDLSKQLKDFAIKHKIGKEDMNSFVKGYMDFAKKEIAKGQEDYAKLQKSWEETNAKTYGENTNAVYQGINEFLNGSEKGKAFSKLLTDNGISKNNIVVDFLNEIQKDYKEGNLVNSNLSGIVQKSDYELLYPEDTKKSN